MSQLINPEQLPKTAANFILSVKCTRRSLRIFHDSTSVLDQVLDYCDSDWTMIILYKGGDLAKFSYGSVYCLCFMCPLDQRPMDVVVDLNTLWTGISEQWRRML